MSKFLKNIFKGDKIRCSPRLKVKADRKAESRSWNRQLSDGTNDVGRKDSKDAPRKRSNVLSRLGPKVNSLKKPNRVSETQASKKRKREDERTLNKRLKYDDDSIADKLDDSVATIFTIDDDSMMEKTTGSSSQTKSLHSQDTNLELDKPKVKSEPGTSCTTTASTCTSSEESRHKVQMWVNDIGRETLSPSCKTSKDETSMIVNFNDTINGRSFLYEDQISECGSDVDESVDKISVVQVAPTPAKSEATCIVVDTNIFIHHLYVLKKVLNHDTPAQIVVLVPWMVLQELDHFKDNTHLRQQARDGLARINKELKKKDPILLGQSVDDASNQRDLGKGPDDKILACCLQQQEKYQKVILLSNDINLGNKAICNNVEVLRPNETNRLLNCTGDSIRKIQDKMSVFLSEVIVFCCQDKFGPRMKGMKTLQGMPWSFNGCLQRIIMYWPTVFHIYLLKQAKTVVGTLIDLSKNGVKMEGKFKFQQFETKVKELLVYIKDIPQYNSVAKQLTVDLSRFV